MLNRRIHGDGVRNDILSVLVKCFPVFLLNAINCIVCRANPFKEWCNYIAFLLKINESGELTKVGGVNENTEVNEK